MRIVEEVPGDLHYRSKYPWSEIKAAIADGKVVELDPGDYPSVSHARSLYSTVYAFAARNGLKWHINTYRGLVYISQKQP